MLATHASIHSPFPIRLRYSYGGQVGWEDGVTVRLLDPRARSLQSQVLNPSHA